MKSVLRDLEYILVTHSSARFPRGQEVAYELGIQISFKAFLLGVQINDKILYWCTNKFLKHFYLAQLSFKTFCWVCKLILESFYSA